MRPTPPQYDQALTEKNVICDLDLFFKVIEVKLEVKLEKNSQILVLC